MNNQQTYIQSFGAILVIDAKNGIICQASENIQLYLFDKIENIIGKPIQKYLPQYTSLLSLDSFPILLDYKEISWIIEKGIVNISTRVLSQSEYYILELEYSSMPEHKVRAFDMIGDIVKSLTYVKTMDKLFETLVTNIQKYLGYDRAILLKNDEYGNGEVIKESNRNEKIPSLLNHTFVLDYYKKNYAQNVAQNKVLFIENIEDKGVSLFAIDSCANVKVNIGITILNKPSEHTRKFLNFLGIKSLLAHNIYVNNKLWGVLLCHHLEERKYVGTEIRKILGLILSFFADKLSELTIANQEKQLVKKEFIFSNIKYSLFHNFDILQSLVYDKINTLDLFEADSFVVFYEKKWERINNDLPQDILEQLVDYLSNQRIKNIYSTQHLVENCPFMLPYVEHAAGILVIEISQVQKEYLIWFRKEIKEKINYIGRNKDNVPAIWTEEINLKSVLWEEYSLNTAKVLYDEIVHILYISNQKIKKMNDDLADLFKKFREADQKLKWMYDSTNNPNFLLDEEAKIIGFNKSTAVLFEKIFNKKLQNNDKIRDYIPDEKNKKDFEKNIQQVKKGETKEFIYYYPDKSDSEYIWKIILFPVYDNYGGFYAVSVSILDITESEKNNKKIAELAAVVQKTNNLVTITDKNRNLTWVNDAFVTSTGYSNEEAIGKTLSFLQGEETDLDTIRFINEQLDNQKSVQAEILNYTKSGKKYWVRLNIDPVFDNEGNLIRFIGVQYDITEIKQKQQELEDAKHKAEEMNRLKTSFLANMSHEIRTPLNGILGLAQVMRAEENVSEIKDLLEMQIKSGWRLLKTIEDILVLSRLEAEGIANTLQKISITNLLDQLLPPLQITAHNKGLKMEYNTTADGLFCWADETMLTQIFHNIIGNAIKFTDKGYIIITTKIENNQICVEVEDTGIGIAEDYLSKIYNSFEQESSGHKRTHEGTGIGLSISKKYIKLLEGDIKVKSTKGKGSTFIVILPIKNN